MAEGIESYKMWNSRIVFKLTLRELQDPASEDKTSMQMILGSTMGPHRVGTGRLPAAINCLFISYQTESPDL